MNIELLLATLWLGSICVSLCVTDMVRRGEGVSMRQFYLPIGELFISFIFFVILGPVIAWGLVLRFLKDRRDQMKTQS